jgi:hypothetical protein
MEIIKVCLFPAAFLLSASALYAMDWLPLNETLVSNFGWNDGGMSILSVSFTGAVLVHVPDDGKLPCRTVTIQLLCKNHNVQVQSHVASSLSVLNSSLSLLNSSLRRLN